jgi:hypothetical protein
LDFPPATEIDLGNSTTWFLAHLQEGTHRGDPERTIEVTRVSGLEARRYFWTQGMMALPGHGVKMGEIHSTGIVVRFAEEMWHVSVAFGLSVMRPDAERVLNSIQVGI